MVFTPLILLVGADECRWRSPWAYYYYMSLRPLLLIFSHNSSFKVNVRQLGCSMSLVTMLRNVIILACAVAQDSAELGQNDLDNLLLFLHEKIVGYGELRYFSNYRAQNSCIN